MRSEKALYNKALGASLIKRCWPIWMIWFALLLFLLPMELLQVFDGLARTEAQLAAINAERRILGSAVDVLSLSIFAAPVVVMLLYSFLYNSRGCGMIAALPISRESVFSTVWLTGLLPLLLAEVLTALITLSVVSPYGVDSGYVWTWLGASALGITAFYGFAAFGAMLTGNIVVMPLVYFALNLAAYLLRELVATTLRSLLYGYMHSRSAFFEKLSPPVAMGYISVSEAEQGHFAFNSFPLLFAYCAAGLLFSVFALLLYRKRRMESAGDTVAIPILKPVFKCCAALAAAFGCAAFLYSELLCRVLDGNAAGFAVVVCLVLGAALGWFAAEMIVQKSVRVFDKWKGALIAAAVVAVFGVCCEADVFGFEKTCPDADKVKSVTIEYYDTTVLTERENIGKAIALHRQLIDDKPINEARGADHESLLIAYELNNGKKVTRWYEYTRTLREDEPTAVAVLLQELMNTPEAIESRAALPEGVTMDDLDQATFTGYYQSEGEYCVQDYKLTRAQAEDFLQNCVLPDTDEGKMLRVWTVPDDEYYSNVSTLEFDLVFRTAEGRLLWKHYKIYLDAPRCTKWIQENTDLRLQSLGEVNEQEK